MLVVVVLISLALNITCQLLSKFLPLLQLGGSKQTQVRVVCKQGRTIVYNGSKRQALGIHLSNVFQSTIGFPSGIAYF